MDVQIVKSKAVSASQLEAWWQLFDSVPDARFYHHPHWQQCLAEHLSPAGLNLGFFADDGQLQMVLPLCVSATQRRRMHPMHDHLSLTDVLIHPRLANDPEKLLKAIRLTLDEPGPRWWDWKVSNLAHQGALIQTLTKILSSQISVDTTAGTMETVQDFKSNNWQLKQTRESASFICTSDNRAPNGKLRRNLRRLRKHMRERGELKVETIVEPERLDQAYAHFLAIEASGWKGSGEQAPAISANPELRAFYQALLSPCVAGIEPRINLLWCGKKCVAAQFAIRTDGCLSLLKIGFDEAYARYSPGYLLLESILDDAPNEGIEIISLVTSPPWAERWHPDTEPVWQLNHYNDSPIGAALHKIDGLTQVVKKRLKQAA